MTNAEINAMLDEALARVKAIRATIKSPQDISREDFIALNDELVKINYAQTLAGIEFSKNLRAR